MKTGNTHLSGLRKAIIGLFVGLPAILMFMMAGGILLSPSLGFFSGVMKIVAFLSCVATAIVLIFLPKETRAKFHKRTGHELRLRTLLVMLLSFGFLSFTSETAFEDLLNSDLREAGYPSQKVYEDITAQGFHSMAEYRAHMRVVAAAKAKAAKARALADALYAEKEKRVVGRWLMPLNADHMITIRHKGRGYEAEFTWTNGDKAIKPLREHKARNGRRFDLIGDVAGTYYVQLTDGSLDIRDKDGEIVHAPRFTGDARNHQAVVDALNNAEQALLNAQKQARCDKDATCTGNAIMTLAMLNCREAIQQRARYDFKWTDGLFGGPMFLPVQDWHGKHGRKRRLIDFIGDKIKLQNGFGAWSNYIYACTVNADTGQVADVKLRPGLFPNGL